MHNDHQHDKQSADAHLPLKENTAQMAEKSAEKTSGSWMKRWFPFGFRDEAKAMVKITVPFAMGNILASWLIGFISLAFIGHVRGQMELNAAALALSTYVLIANSLMLGLNFGCDTLLPQCFGGNKRKMGLTVQRAVLIIGYSCFISWTLMLNAKFALRLIESDREVVELTDTFLRSFLVAVPFDGLSMLLQKYIASNEKTWPLLVINFIGNIVNVLSNYLCLYQFDLGIRSVPISMTIAYAINCLCAFVYIRCSSIYAETWHPINRACLREWNIYLKLSVPGVFMVMTEFWSIELSIFFAALLGARSLSAQVCAYQTAWLMYLITSSFATAANIRIGQYLGAGKPLEAENAKNVTYAVGGLVILMNMSLLVTVHHWFPYAYNTEAEALTLARRVLLLVALLQIWDGYNVINTGIVKACGQQKRGALIAFSGFYLFGIPISVLLMFYVRLNIYGFWCGIIAAETVTNGLLFVLIERFKWERHANKAQRRIHLDPTDNSMELVLDDISHAVETDVIGNDAEHSWFMLLKVKVPVLILLICFFIAGLIISTKIPLYP